MYVVFYVLVSYFCVTTYHKLRGFTKLPSRYQPDCHSPQELAQGGFWFHALSGYCRLYFLVVVELTSLRLPGCWLEAAAGSYLFARSVLLCDSFHGWFTWVLLPEGQWESVFPSLLRQSLHYNLTISMTSCHLWNILVVLETNHSLLTPKTGNNTTLWLLGDHLKGVSSINNWKMGQNMGLWITVFVWVLLLNIYGASFTISACFIAGVAGTWGTLILLE